MENAPGQIYALIPKIMAEVGAIGKGRMADMGKGGKYAFRGIDDVYNAVQPALVMHGVTVAPVGMEVIQRDEREKMWDGKATGTVLIYSVLRVTYRFFAPDGSFIECVAIGEAMDSGDKCINKAMSAAMKYALFQTLCIPTEEPKDTENDHHEASAAREQQRPPARPADFLDSLSAALAKRGMADSKCLSALKFELDEQAKSKGKTFNFENPAQAVATAVLKQVAAGKFDHLKDAA